MLDTFLLDLALFTYASICFDSLQHRPWHEAIRGGIQTFSRAKFSSIVGRLFDTDF